MGNQCFKKTLLLQLQLLLSIVSASILLSLESANALNNFWIQGKTVNDWFDKAHANQNINVSASLGLSLIHIWKIFTWACRSKVKIFLK